MDEEARQFARMMAHESRRTTIDRLVDAARITLAKAEDENAAAMLFGLNLATTESGSLAVIKFATMVGMLAVEIAQLRDAANSPERDPSRG